MPNRLTTSWKTWIERFKGLEGVDPLTVHTWQISDRRIVIQKINSMSGFELNGLIFDAGVDLDFYVNEEDILKLFADRSLEQGCGIDALTEVR